ncbi:hypothetical protein FRX31_013799, partial [Thalictrum thalictroides]
MEHDELARSQTVDDLSRKRKVLETEPQSQSLQSDIPIVKKNVFILLSEKVASVGQASENDNSYAPVASDK